MNVIDSVANEPSLTGFGAHSAQEVEALQKALSISQNYGTTSPNAISGGTALAVEDLDRTLKLVTHGLEHLKLWKDIIKDRIPQTVHEFNVQNSYGDEVSPFFAMGGNPVATDANYDREVVQVKYLGTQGQVQHNLTLIQAAHGPVIAREVKNKTIELLARNERAMFEADASINTLEYDGLDTQIRTKESTATYKSAAFAGYEAAGTDESVVLDVRGAFTDVIAEDMALKNVNNFGMAMHCYMGTDIHSNFSKTFFSKQRTLPGETLTSGNRIKEHTGTIDYKFRPSLFNRPRKSPLTVTVSSNGPGTTGVITRGAGAGSKFTAADAGTYSYVVSYVYADGETVASPATSVVGVVAGDVITAPLVFSPAGALYANIFRADVGTVIDHKFIGRVPLVATTNPVIIDKNFKVPGSATAYLLMHDTDALCWKQLGSMIKYDLAVTDTSYKWLQLLYGTILVSAARKHTIAENLTG